MHCVVVGGIKWKVIGDIRDKDPYYYENVGVYGFGF